MEMGIYGNQRYHLGGGLKVLDWIGNHFLLTTPSFSTLDGMGVFYLLFSPFPTLPRMAWPGMGVFVCFTRPIFTTTDHS
jgi:hypothetical protein